MNDFSENIRTIITDYLDKDDLDKKSKENLNNNYISKIIQSDNEKILLFIQEVRLKYPHLQILNYSNFMYGNNRCWKIYIELDQQNKSIYALLISVFGFFTIMKENKNALNSTLSDLIEENELLDEEEHKFLNSLFDLVKLNMSSLKWIPKSILKKRIKEIGITNKNFGDIVVFDLLF